MENKRIGWVIMLVAAAVLLYLWWGRQKEPAPDSAARPRPRAAATASAPTTQAEEAAGHWRFTEAPEEKHKKKLLGSLDPKSGYVLRLELVGQGAAAYTLKLAEHFANVADKQLYEALDGDHKRYEQQAAKDPDCGGHYSLLNPVALRGSQYLSFATDSIRVAVEGKEGRAVTLDLNHPDLVPWQYLGKKAVTERVKVKGVQTTVEGIEATFAAVLRYSDDPNAPFEEGEDCLKITKTYTVFKNDYTLRVRLNLENLSGRKLIVSVDQRGPTGVPREDLRSDRRLAMYGKLQKQGNAVQVIAKPRKEILDSRKTDLGKEEYVWPSGEEVVVGVSDEKHADFASTLWLGYVNKFFGSMMYLRSPVEQRLEATSLQANFYVLPAVEPRTRPSSPPSRTFVTGVKVGVSRKAPGWAPDLVLQPQGDSGDTKQLTFDIFAGPKKPDTFGDAALPRSDPGQYQRLNYIGTIDFGGCFCAWDRLTLGMMWLLRKISIISLGNYGVAIMILVVLVRGVLHPLTRKGQVNMMKMQKLSPEMAKIKKKYADDKEALQREMMKFYKQQGATPFLGCLPMFLQMPIWIALWTSLNAAVDLRHAAFLPVWITDLSAPDALWAWGTPFDIPLLSNFMGPITSFNLLPILLCVAMFFQAKLNPQMSQPTAAATPEQQQQQKMMRVMMPVMMLLFFYSAPSGLTLYIMTSTFVGLGEQYLIRRHIKAREAAEAAATTTVKVPGKAPRGSRPKKPKGPFWMKHK